MKIFQLLVSEILELIKNSLNRVQFQMQNKGFKKRNYTGLKLEQLTMDNSRLQQYRE